MFYSLIYTFLISHQICRDSYSIVTIHITLYNIVLSYRGIPNTVPEVKAIYPSFDVVPPHLISGVVTDKGVYVPYLLDHYFDSDVKKFY